MIGSRLSWRDRVRVSKREEIVESGVEGLTIRALIRVRVWEERGSSLEFVKRSAIRSSSIDELIKLD